MNLALFDFDGTITRGDMFTPFLRFAIQPGRAVLGGLLISPVLIAHRLRLVSTSSARPIVARAGFQGVRADVVRALGERYAAEVLPEQLSALGFSSLVAYYEPRPGLPLVYGCERGDLHVYYPLSGALACRHARQARSFQQ